MRRTGVAVLIANKDGSTLPFCFEKYVLCTTRRNPSNSNRDLKPSSFAWSGNQRYEAKAPDVYGSGADAVACCFCRQISISQLSHDVFCLQPAEPGFVSLADTA